MKDRLFALKIVRSNNSECSCKIYNKAAISAKYAEVHRKRTDIVRLKNVESIESRNWNADRKKFLPEIREDNLTSWKRKIREENKRATSFRFHRFTIVKKLSTNHFATVHWPRKKTNVQRSMCHWPRQRQKQKIYQRNKVSSAVWEFARLPIFPLMFDPFCLNWGV